MSEASLNSIVAEYKRQVAGARTYSEIRAVSMQFGITVKLDGSYLLSGQAS